MHDPELNKRIVSTIKISIHAYTGGGGGDTFYSQTYGGTIYLSLALNAPDFVADNFFCESARDKQGYSDGFFANDTLWPGMEKGVLPPVAAI